MDSDLLKILSEELRETRNLAVAAQQKADAAWAQVEINRAQMELNREQVELNREQVEINREYIGVTAANLVAQTNDLRELIIITRNQIKDDLAELRRPWWKKLFGVPAQS